MSDEIGDLLATGGVPAEPAALAAALPDLPRWVETRWMLRKGAGWTRTAGGGTGVVVLADELRLGAVVGHPDPAMLGRVLREALPGFALIVQLSDLAHVRGALSGWAAPVLATIHRLSTRARADAPPDSGVVVLAPPDGELVSRLPADMRREAPYATAMALRLAGGSPVSVCQATAVTETLWDAGVQTAEGHRRRGHAAACFRALAAYMAAAGKEPVWGAEEGNRASIELARKLGFEPAERVAIMRPPAGSSAARTEKRTSSDTRSEPVAVEREGGLGASGDVGDNTTVPELAVQRADVTKLEVDAIANAANTELQHGGGVAKAISKAGGPAVQEESDEKAPIALGEAVETTAGDMPARYVIHAATMELGGPTSREIIEQATESTLRRAEELGCRSLGLVAFGTGVGGFPVEEAAEVMAGAARAHRGEKLERVVFCVQGEEAERAFAAAIAEG